MPGLALMMAPMFRTPKVANHGLLSRAIGVMVPVALALGCGSSGAQRPDTHAGASQPVPATENCTDLCERLGACVEILCNEDSKSSRYTGLGDVLTLQCESTCADATVQSGFDGTQWQCVFQSSCRQAIDYDTCHVKSSYSCT